MKWLLTKNEILVPMGFGCGIAGLVVGYIAQDFNWLSRFGAVMTGVGIILLARPNISGYPLAATVYGDTPYPLYDQRHYRTKGEEIPEWVHQDRPHRMAVERWGPWFCLVGTLTNGFGSLLNNLL